MIPGVQILHGTKLKTGGKYIRNGLPISPSADQSFGDQ